MKLLCALLLLLSTYSERMYHTVCAVPVDAPAEVSDSIFARFIGDVQTNPDALFDWAFYGVGTQEDEEKNAFLFEYKEIIYLPEENYGRATMDVVIPGLIRFRDITLDGEVLDEHGPIIYHPDLCADSLTIADVPAWMRHFYLDAHYSGKLLQHGYGNMFIIPVDATHSVFMMDINVRYGWFFNIFVTMKVYRNSVEWRVNRYMQNLKQVAEGLYQEQIIAL